MKRLTLVLTMALGLLVSGYSFANEEAAADTQTKKLADWCQVTCPVKVSTNEEFVVKLKLTGVKGPVLLAANLMGMKADGGFGGFLKWGGAAREVNGDSEQEYKFKFAGKPGVDKAFVCIFLSKTGEWADKTVSVNSPAMPVSAKE